MKKILLTAVITFMFGGLYDLYAQCNPITSPCTNGAAVVSFGGLCDTTIADGIVGSPYSDNIQFYIEGVCFDPNDVGVPPPIPGVTARITRLHSFSFGSLPNGVSAGTNQTQYLISSGATVYGCAYFTGTPTQAGQFSVAVGISGDYTTGGCFFITQTGTAPVTYNINYNVLPNANFSGLAASYCELNPSATLTPTGTAGGTFTGPGVSGNTFNPAVAGPGTHTITYTVTAQEGVAVGPTTNSSSQTVTVTSANIYYADTDNDNFGDPMDSIVICSSNTPAGYVTNNIDCAPTNGAVYPGATEICDGIDNNCNGQVNEGLTVYTYYADTDNDGFGDPLNSIDTCLATPPTGYVTDNTDCEPNINAINPNATEICDGIDNNCNGQIDEGLQLFTYYADTDNDNFGDPLNSIDTCLSSPPMGYVTDNNDCDDGNGAINPLAAEICDGEDNNCNGQIDEGLAILTFYADFDGDGFGDVSNSVDTCLAFAPPNYVTDSTDCNDLLAGINPNATDIPGNFIDEDCDGSDATLIIDNDNDTFDNTVDCNDNNALIYPGAPELCDTLDNDCDGLVDDSLAVFVYYIDSDNDNFGDPNDSIVTCLSSAPAGYVVNNGDCNDANGTIYSGAPELCDGLDNDCNGQVDDGLPLFTYYIDTDNDGFGNATVSIDTCLSSPPAGYVADNTDCDDSNLNISPSALEVCNGIDDDCNGLIDDGLPLFTYYADTDNDGFGDATNSIDTCLSSAPAGFVADNTDCNDTNMNINPNATEVCDGIDNDCNGQIDDGLPVFTYYYDQDFDGYGTPDSSITVCNTNVPAGFSGNDLDCNDNDININPNSPEICDNIDNDCSGTIDDGIQTFMYFYDGDGDGFGSADSLIMDCSISTPQGYVMNNLDCDDSDFTINPSSSEFCDSIDNNCNGQIDEGLVFNTFYVDADNDGFGNDTDPVITDCVSSPPTGYSPFNTDCNDNDNTIFPGATEIDNDGIDQDCNPATTVWNRADEFYVKIYPNPTKSLITIEMEDANDVQVQVIDLNGSVVNLTISTAPKGFSIDMNSLVNGVYLIKITAQNGSYAVKKIIKSN